METMFKKYQLNQPAEKPKKYVPPEFGEDIRSQEFILDPAYSFMNTGGRGATPRQVMEETHSRTMQIEMNLDWYFSYDKEAEIAAATEVLASFINADPKDLSFVENTTRGLNNMIKTIIFSPGDAILQNNYTYSSVKRIHETVAEEKGVQLLTIDHPFPITSTEQIVQQYRDMFATYSNIRLATIDHISSIPVIMFPIREIIEVCKENDALVLIDGAQCVGQVPVDLTELAQLGVDFYAGNTNKWSFGSKNCAFQWVAPALHTSSKPVVTTQSVSIPYPDNMFEQGTRNDAPYLAYPVAKDFYSWIGGWDAITSYNVSLVDEGVALLQAAWQTERYPIPPEMEAPFMRMLTIPDTLAYPKSNEGARRLSLDLTERFQIMPYISFRHDELMTRLSVQVFVVLNDFVRLRDAVMILKDEEPDNPKQQASKAKAQMMTRCMSL